MRTGEKRLLKRDPVLGRLRPVRLRDRIALRPGARRPADPGVASSIARISSRDGSAPLLQYAYGAYGLSMDPEFSSARFSLLDRGFVYAIAHVRGGQEMGRAWYDDGRLLHKKNSFTDFIDVTRLPGGRGLRRTRTRCSRWAAAPAAC